MRKSPRERIDDMIDCLWEEGKRSEKDLTLTEREELTGLILLSLDDGARDEYLMDADLDSDVSRLLGIYMSTHSKESANNLLNKLVSNAVNYSVTKQNPNTKQWVLSEIDELFEHKQLNVELFETEEEDHDYDVDSKWYEWTGNHNQQGEKGNVGINA